MGFDWIGDIFRRLLDLFPRVLIVDTAHGAVKFVLGKKAVSLGPGWHWYWPFTTEIKEYPTARQSLDLRTITTVTKDKVTLLIGGMIVYSISDIKSIVAHTWDADNTIHDIAVGAISNTVCGRYTYDELMARRQSGELDSEIRERVKADLGEYGINVIALRLPDLCPVRVYKVIGGANKPGDS